MLGARAAFGPSEQEQAADRFVTAWEREDYPAMHGLLTPESQERIDGRAFAFAYEQSDATATKLSIDAGDPDGDDEAITVPVSVRTIAFGDIRQALELPIRDGRVEWTPNLVFPGLAGGERLTRRTRAPKRTSLIARRGKVLVEGPADGRSSPLGVDATSVAGTVGRPTDAAERERLYARGFPRDASQGLTGLERVFERQLAGTPGGKLLAGDRELASTSPRPAEPVKTTIDADLHRAAISALAGRVGGVTVLDARGGELRALAGSGLGAAQPPGSVFKLVTTTAALEGGDVKVSDRFPSETAAVIGGVPLRNAGGESCGGSFTDSFAHSCNSVFAPLGVKVGDKRLVETAESYGFNRPPAIPSAEESTIPQPAEIESDLELGATAIGQGKILATPLEMASITQAVAARGRQAEPRVAADAPVPQPVDVTSGRVAGEIGELMEAVVDYGTGEEAAVPGLEIAGKTGTAELGEGITEHAWFVAFAPAKRPKLALAVMIANGGAGGEVAAPVARRVLEAGLSR